MKFGLYSSIANPPRGEQLDRCIDEVIAEAQLAEASGFDSCFFGEHHQDTRRLPALAADRGHRGGRAHARACASAPR